jgi:acetoin utilization deacetylase AcuC-like enzyme
VTDQGPREPQPSPGTGSPPGEVSQGDHHEFVDPQKLLRIAGVTREVLEEARRIRPENAAIDHLRRVHSQITNELKEALPDELFQELDQLTPEVHDGTLEELSLAHAEILGWLEGLFQGTQLAIQMQAARAFQQRPPGQLPAPLSPEASPSDRSDGRYL